MSDIITYNAIKKYLEYNASSACCSATVLSQSLAVISGMNSANTALDFQSNKYGPHQTTDTQSWAAIPQMTSPTGGFKVCDTSGYFRCGACCLWTVPAGVTCAQFQIWGAGGGTSVMCCCGGSPFGPTGAYATVIIPVTAGDSYTLCAGCAYCCYATMDPTGHGCASYVTGNGLTNFCAQGGISCVCSWERSISCALGIQVSNGYAIPMASRTCGSGFSPYASASLNSCGTSQWNFCYDASTDYMFLDLYTFSCVTKFYGSATNGTVYGLSGMYPKIVTHSPGNGCCYIPGNCYKHISAPVYGFLSTSVKEACSPTSGTVGGCAGSFPYGNGCFQNPGSGGWFSYVNGGSGACVGDSGRMGMVCVRYC